jgi:pyruvate dehydrogenase E1 component beta subunit
MVAQIPGLKIVMPSNAAEAKGLLKTAIREDNPVVFIEHRMQYREEFEVPEGEYMIPFGQARIVTEGKDLTVVATSNVKEC